MFARGLGDVVLDVLGHLDTVLRGGCVARQIRHQRRERVFGRGEQAQQPARGVDGVVHPDVLVGETDVPGEFTTDDRSGGMHLLLDERVPGRPHHRDAPRRLEHARQRLRALHVKDQLLARTPAFEHLQAEKEKQDVAPHHRAGFVHHPDAVGIAVEADAQSRSGPANLRRHVHDILVDRGIGVMVREGPVELAVEGDHVGSDRLQHRHRGERPGSVRAVHDHLQRRDSLEPARDVGDVPVENVDVFEGARSATGHSFIDPSPQLLNPFAVQRPATHGHLDPVPFGGVVAAGDLSATVRRQLALGPVGHRRGYRAAPDDVPACRADALRERAGQPVRTGTVVAPDHDARMGIASPCAHRRDQGAPGGAGHLVVDGFANDAPDVVLPEDLGRKAQNRYRPEVVGCRVMSRGCRAIRCRVLVRTR